MENVESTPKKQDYIIKLKILGIITVYKFTDLKKKQKEINNMIKPKLKFNNVKNVIEKSTKQPCTLNNVTNKVIGGINRFKFEKILLYIGFNTNDYVKNSYINATLNSILCMLINKNKDNFNFNKLYYMASISKYNYYVICEGIISISVIKNMDVIITLIKIASNLKKEKARLEKQNKKIVIKM